MAQYRHLPIYKATYDLLLKVTELTRHFPKDFKHSLAAQLRDETIGLVVLIYRANSLRPRQSLNSYLGMLRHVEGWRQRQRLACAAAAHGIRFNSALTKVLVCNT